MKNPTSYHEAEIHLGQRDSRKVANNTYLIRHTGSITLRLHGTDVVTYLRDGSLILTTGGYNTATTRDRLNAFTPSSIHVYQRAGHAFVSSRGKEYRMHDGIMFGPRGGCRNPLSGSVTKRKDAQEDATKAQIDQYIDGWIETAVTGQMPLPSGADCWFCTGMIPPDASHLRDHMEERYYVPSLILRAIVAKGYSSPAVALQFICDLRPNEEGTRFDGTKVQVKEVRTLLRGYMRSFLTSKVAA